MNWLKYVGDTDILREATQASTVFMFRARRAWKMNALFGGATLFFLLIVVLLVLGPEGSGIWWATREATGAAVAIVGILWMLFLGYLLFKYMPGRNDRVVLNLRHYVTGNIDPLEEGIRALSDEALEAKTAEFKQRVADGATIDDIRPEAYACIREASRRAKEHRQFECQLIGGRVLEGNNVAEMRTGEGKTIVCYMGNYMKVIQGLKVHMVTTNDYLVKRDAEFCQPIFERLGVSVGYISSQMDSYGPGVEERRQNYGCDITYGTNSEFGFDYLRDNMKYSTRDQVQGKQHYVVVDEVDSILIDEARTPLIISGPAHDDLTNYKVADGVAQTLIRKQEQSNREMAIKLPEVEANPSPEQRQNAKFPGAVKKFKTDPLWLTSDEADAIGHLQYFVVELDRKSAHMTEHGAKLAQGELGIGTFYDSKNMNWPHYIDNAVRAHLTYRRDRDYIVRDNEIIIIDEFTGREMPGRQWSDGLHQAVEAKERVTIKQETQTLATITLQNLFKLYDQLSGMTGTALTESEEFMKIYRLEVIAIPTNRPIRRLDFNDKIYRTKVAKFDALVDEIYSYAHDGVPSDPFSLHETLRIARRTLKEAEFKGLVQSSESKPLIEKVDAAIKTFNSGDGDSKPMMTAYYDLLGGKQPGRPVLVGTVSVEASEKLSETLTRRHGIDHEVLNAKNHAREADIITKAGQQHEQTRGKKKTTVGNVTISTNMAGRGTDIRLGEGVRESGGLHVVGSDRHESRRIDNQLRGRCGRQGDSGSSRFFLSVEDDLLRLFMGEWMLKMLGMLGFEGEMAIEDKRLSRGIENAQKKVEERNFGIRKNLLEYDEVMAYQRGEFYTTRQRIVEGRGLSELIWQYIDETVEDAVGRYFDPRYPANCVVEWISQNLNVQIEASKLDTTDAETLQEKVRDLATSESQASARRTFGEYIDGALPPEEWDVRGASAWMAGYDLTISQNQMQKMDPNDLLDQVLAASDKQIAKADLTPILQYTDKELPKAQLRNWAHEKFGLDIELDDVNPQQLGDAVTAISDKMRSVYRERELAYPVEAAMQYAAQAGGQNEVEVFTVLARWTDRKFKTGWTYEHFKGKTGDQIFSELKSLNEAFTNGRFESELDTALAEHSGEAIVNWSKSRFGSVVDAYPIDPESDDLRTQLKECAYQMSRWELTQLERHVLLTTLDAIWKDHMYAMDMLRHGIGLRGYAEKDPKIEYKREGTRMFGEMQENVRERVTDLIFRVRIAGAGGEDEQRNQLSSARTQKDDPTNIGINSAAQADHEQQGDQSPQTIRRDEPKVGRNDLCPCGSGKKYKHCCGKKA